MIRPNASSIDDWFSAEELGLSDDLGKEWDVFRLGLVGARIALNDQRDQIV